MDIAERLRLLESVVMHTQDAVVVTYLGPDSEPIIAFVNPALSAQTGYSSAEVVGRHPGCLLSPRADLPTQLEIRAAVEGGRSVRVEILHGRKDGSEFWVENSITPLADASGRTAYFISIQRDVTERRESQASLRASERRFRSLVQNAADAIILCSADGEVLYSTPNAEQILGGPVVNLLTSLASERVHPVDRERVVRAFRDAIQGVGRQPHFEFRMARPDGTTSFIEATLTNLIDDPAVGGLVINARDVSERKAVEEELAHQALHDPLTGLPNRALFVDRLTLALLRLERQPGQLAVLFADLDRFKVINDSLGHDAGDAVLVDLASRLAEVVRPGDTVARFGGDEFVVLCENVSGESEALSIADRLAHVTDGSFRAGGHEVFVTMSTGVALANSARVKPQDLVRDADAAMYRAKDQGRARSALFDQTMRTWAISRLETENALRRALDRDEFHLVYQPVVRIADGRVIGAEALIRWCHPTRGPIGPAEFIAVAEETGLIEPIGEWVFAEACRQSRLWADAAPGHRLVTSVNLSGRQFARADLAARLGALLDHAAIDPDQICLEITESVLMGDAEATIASLRDLKALGVSISVDDFGTGYSSLAYLKRFPVDELKVDRSFVAGLGRVAEDSAIVAAVMGLAHALGLRSVAEGVENDRQLYELRALGCERAQGYHFARPLMPDGVSALLEPP